MRRSGFIVFCFLICTVTSKAQQNFDSSLIPKELLPYASAVVRNKDELVEVKDLDNVVYHVKEAVTVLNKNGDDLAHIVVEHDKNNIIKNIKGNIYDSFGKQIGKFTESDFDDVSAGHDFSLFEDVRLKHYLPAMTNYPYTIAYEYEVRSKQSLEIPTWQPNPGTGMAIEKSTYTFLCKPDFAIRYKETQVPEPVKTGTTAQGLKTYTWSVNNLKAVKYEPYSPDKSNFLTSVRIAPEKFVYYGINGTYRNWQELGKWEYDKLIADRQTIPDETVQHIREITKDIADPKLKAKKVYEYMQAKTHYISVQVGIGGNQPFLASEVDKQNYGDCKALVNYTQALLKAAGIESYYCVVEADHNQKISLKSDFASMDQGNHIILCLPFKNDTTWADCTSQTIPFGYIGDFTDDRNVLACTPQGGRLMHTPKYTVQQNQEIRKANFTIAENGEISGSMLTTFKGTNYEDRDYMLNESPADQFRMLQRKYPINNLAVEKFDLKQEKTFDPVTTETIKLHAPEYASFNDGKYYFSVNTLNRITEPPRQVRNRVNSVYINEGKTEDDEITFTIPAGYRLEKTPLNTSIDKPFGKFSANITLKGNQLVYKRKLQLFDGTYSKDTYADLVDFFQSVVDDDEYSVVLVKN